MIIAWMLAAAFAGASVVSTAGKSFPLVTVQVDDRREAPLPVALLPGSRIQVSYVGGKDGVVVSRYDAMPPFEAENPEGRPVIVFSGVRVPFGKLNTVPLGAKVKAVSTPPHVHVTVGRALFALGRGEGIHVVDRGDGAIVVIPVDQEGKIEGIVLMLPAGGTPNDLP